MFEMRVPLAPTPEHANEHLTATADEDMWSEPPSPDASLSPVSPMEAALRSGFSSRRSSSAGSLPFQSLPPPPQSQPPQRLMRVPTPTRRWLAPLVASVEEVNPLRRRVESCLLQRERTVAQLTAWLRNTYRIQQNVGAKYASGGGADLRRWNTMSSSTRDDHRVKLALLLASIRMQTCELVEALEDWRHSRPTLLVTTASGRTKAMPRPFVWRGRWWPLQLMLDPPLLPLPLPCDPLLLRWFERTADATMWCDAEGTAQPELFAASAWHPAKVLQRMQVADARLHAEADALELRTAELTRQRHSTSGEGSGGSAPALLQHAGRFLPGSASSLEPPSAAWTSDGASIQLARLLYGGPKPYALAMRALCKAVDAAWTERERRIEAATVMQSIVRGRKERKNGRCSHLTFSFLKIKRGQPKAIRTEGRLASFYNAASKPGKSIQDGLRDALTANLSRVMDLFREWDTDGNGMIDRKEFHKAIRALGVRAPRAEVNTLFDTFDADGGGTLEASELAKVLRRGAGDDVKLAAGLEAGAKGEIEVRAKNKFSLRQHARDGNSSRAGVEPTIENLRRAMSADKLRVKDIMNALDKDQDGSCSRSEFRQVLPMLGFDIGGHAAIDALFDSFDADRSGEVDFEELHRMLRYAFEPVREQLNEHDNALEAALRLQKYFRRRSARTKLLKELEVSMHSHLAEQQET